MFGQSWCHVNNKLINEFYHQWALKIKFQSRNFLQINFKLNFLLIWKFFSGMTCSTLSCSQIILIVSSSPGATKCQLLPGSARQRPECGVEEVGLCPGPSLHHPLCPVLLCRPPTWWMYRYGPIHGYCSHQLVIFSIFVIIILEWLNYSKKYPYA